MWAFPPVLLTTTGGQGLQLGRTATRWLKVEGKLQRRADALVVKASKVTLATARD